MGRKDDRSIRNEARSRSSVGFPMNNARPSMGDAGASISDECPLICAARLSMTIQGVPPGRARALSRGERPSARSERGSGRNEGGSGRNEGGSGRNEGGSGRSERGSGRGERGFARGARAL